jgi:hypothetical protein
MMKRELSKSNNGVRLARIVATLAFLLLTSQAFGQQYVSRYNAFVGYTFLDSPKVNLFEPGLHIQAGINPRTWYAMGFDYTRTSGDLTLTPNLLPDTLQQQLGGMLQQLAAAGKLPPGYTLSVKSSSETQTFAAGPQLMFRHWSRFTPFVRPSIGAIREVATPAPADPIATLVVHQLAPAGHKSDWTGFYGFGGGVDLIASRHLQFRVQADFVRDHLFNDILKDSRNTVRFSVGPSFAWGRRVE